MLEGGKLIPVVVVVNDAGGSKIEILLLFLCLFVLEARKLIPLCLMRGHITVYLSVDVHVVINDAGVVIIY